MKWNERMEMQRMGKLHGFYFLEIQDAKFAFLFASRWKLSDTVQ